MNLMFRIIIGLLIMAIGGFLIMEFLLPTLYPPWIR